MQNDDKYEYGRIDPSRDESVNLFEAVSSEGLQGGDSRLWNSLPLDDSEINVVLKTKASSSAGMSSHLFILCSEMSPSAGGQESCRTCIIFQTS